MKVFFLLGLLAFSQTLLADDKYVMETCFANLSNGETITMTRLNNKTGYFLLSPLWGTYREMPGYDDVVTSTENMSLVIDIKKQGESKKKTDSEGCKTKEFDRVVEVVSIKSELRKKYDLKAGEKVKLECTTFAFKTYNECNLTPYAYEAE